MMRCGLSSDRPVETARRAIGRLVVAVVAAGCLVAGGRAASAQSDAGGPSPSLTETGDRLSLPDAGLTAYKPEGWVRSEPPEGAVLTLRAAGRETIRLEVRAERDLDDSDREQFFSSFHAKLLAAGFRRENRRTGIQAAGTSGVQTRYKVRSGETPYRLVIWQASVGRTAWMVVGFFPEARLASYMETFQQFTGALRLDEEPSAPESSDPEDAGVSRGKTEEPE